MAQECRALAADFRRYPKLVDLARQLEREADELETR